MCGIAAVMGAEGPHAQSLLPGLMHRGPDSSGSSTSPGCSLAMSRLAITDPMLRSDQPMTVGADVIVFNGELYNYRILRAELECIGTSFETAGDTEVVLKSIVRWGPRAFDRFIGMYAVIVWNKDRNELLAARDPSGIKPLYWCGLPNGSTAIASEARPLFDEYKMDVDPTGLAEYLRFGSPVTRTVFSGVSEVPAGYAMRWARDGTWVHRIARPAATGDLPTEFRRAVAGHSSADRPIALLLSGGFDSAAILSALPRSRIPGTTAITVHTGENVRDVERAQVTARHYGVKHVIANVPTGVVKGLSSDYLDAVDQPTVEGFNTYLACRAASEHGFPCVISGLGADELLGGYGYYRRARHLRTLGRLVSWAPALSDGAASVISRRWGRSTSQASSMIRATDSAEMYLAWRGVFTQSETNELMRREGSTTALGLFAADATVRRGSDDYRALDEALYLRATLLRDADVYSMSVGVELRVPFLDTQLVGAFGEGCPSTSKAQFAALYRDPYLSKIASRKKMSFALPWWRWIADGDVKGAIVELDDPWGGYLDPVVARRLLVGAREGTYAGIRRWSLILLAAWIQRLGRPRRLGVRSL